MMKVTRCWVGCVVVLLLMGVSTGVGLAGPVLDQVSLPSPGGAAISPGATSPSDIFQQGVTCGVTGLLTSFELYAWTAGSATVFVNKGLGWQADASEFSTTMTSVGQGWYSFDASAAGIYLNDGDAFMIGAMSGDGSMTWSSSAN